MRMERLYRKTLRRERGPAELLKFDMRVRIHAVSLRKRRHIWFPWVPGAVPDSFLERWP